MGSKKTIAESLRPTFENVTREFITDTMYKILFSEKLPNFKFEFREDEAITFIENIINEYANKYDFYKERAEKILESIKQKSNTNESKPVMIINDYKEFFEMLRQYYEQDIELFFKSSQMSGFPVYEKNNCFEQIWLRATPDDFNNPEKFLKKQVEMLKDKTFEKYDEETYLGKLSFLDDNIICIKNGISRTWDENSREMQITIYDKKHYNNTQLFSRPHYILPVIRYGIYKNNGKKVCYIGSIQNKNQGERENDLCKKLDRKKYKLNSGVPEEDTSKVEPKNILALSLFVNLLHKEGVTEIEIPSMYVLDYEYHEKRHKVFIEEFKKKWTKERRDEDPEGYERDMNYLLQSYKKEDLISEIKTERFIKTFRRLLYHYPNGNIKSYPGEIDNFLHFKIPTVTSENEIRGDMLKEIYHLVEEKYLDIER